MGQDDTPGGVFAISRERPHFLIAGLAAFLVLATLVMGISIPLVFLGLVVLAAAVGTLIRPEIGLHVLVVNALVGLTHVVEMPRVGPFSAPILIEGLVVVALMFQAAFFGRRLPIGTRQHALMGVLAIWILLSVMTGVSVGPENFRQYRNLFLVRLVMFFLVTALMTTRAHLKRLIATIVVANIGLLAVSTAVRAGWFGQERITVSQEFERVGALVQNPNELAFSLTTMLVVAVCMSLHVRSLWLKALLIGLAAADLITIMLTLSRSGFVSLCFVLLFLFFKLTRNLRAVLVLVALIACGWLMMPEELFERFGRIDQVRDVDRIQIVQVGAAMALDNPLLGVGLGNYVSVFWDYNVSNMKRPAPSHNMYLDLAAQMGLPSLLAYIAIFGITWRALRRLEVDLAAQGRARSFDFLLGLAIQAFFVNLAVFGMSGDVEFDYGAFIMLGIAMTLLREGGVGASGRN